MELVLRDIDTPDTNVPRDLLLYLLFRQTKVPRLHAQPVLCFVHTTIITCAAYMGDVSELYLCRHDED